MSKRKDHHRRRRHRERRTRQTAALETLAADLPGITTIAADATDEAAAARVFSSRAPDVLVLSLGARPPIGTIGDQRWDEFSRPWNVDVRASLLRASRETRGSKITLQPMYE